MLFLKQKLNKFFLSLGALLFLQGCQSMPSFADFDNFFSLSDKNSDTQQLIADAQENSSPLTEQMSFFIESAKPGDIVLIEKSPWASQHEIMAKDFYYSATGKKCREVRLLHNVEGLPHEQHLCVNETDQWVPIRCISR